MVSARIRDPGELEDRRKEVHEAHGVVSFSRGYVGTGEDHGNSQNSVRAASLVLPMARLLIQDLTVIGGDGKPAPARQGLSVEGSENTVNPTDFSGIGSLFTLRVVIPNSTARRRVGTMRLVDMHPEEPRRLLMGEPHSCFLEGLCC